MVQVEQLGIRSDLIVVAIHSAMPTGAPRIGFEVAAYLASRGMNVRLLATEDGAIVSEARERGVSVHVADKLPDFADPDVLLEACTTVLQKLGPGLIYCNSLAASQWAIAGKRIGARVILHAHELRGEMQTLMNRGRLMQGVGICADGLVVAAPRAIADFSSVVGNVPAKILDLGVFIDPAEIKSRSARMAHACWPFGREFQKTRPVVGMSGYGGIRKGFDRFIEIAKKLTSYDFIWIGDVTDRLELNRYLKDLPALKNVYVTGWVTNPLPFLAQLDAFLLTSREDPNPIAALEAYSLGVPLIVFTETGETWRNLRGGCYAFFGEFNEEVAADAIRMLIETIPVSYYEVPMNMTKEYALTRLRDFLSEFISTPD